MQMSLKVLSESDILRVLSVLTREGRGSTLQIQLGGIDSGFETVYERDRLFEVLNDVAFNVNDDDGSRGQNREQEPQPEGRDLRGGETAMAARYDDGVRGRRPVGLGRRLGASEGKLKIAQAALAKAERTAQSRSSRKRRSR